MVNFFRDATGAEQGLGCQERTVGVSIVEKIEGGGRMSLDDHEPDPAWWRHKPWGLHGVTHACRVLIWSEVVAQYLIGTGQSVDLEVVRWSAVLHDCQRVDDGDDFPHGNRCAAWILEVKDRICPKLSARQTELLRHSVKWHVPHDNKCPDFTPELMCLKDGDGLDRVRLGDFDPAYLRTPALKNAQADATTLMQQTVALRGPGFWDAIKTVARSLGRWPK
jgi:hypothetical protein